ncbi:hypothetical protein DITRI_Ditri03aG0098200 [Diplodiscus trichospermus]
MASVSFLQLHDPQDDVVANHHNHHPDQSLNLDSNPYWSHDFHFSSSSSSSSSDPDLPHQEEEVSLSGPLITNGPDLFDRRENHVNFVMDLFHQRVEQSKVISNTTPNNNTNFGNQNFTNVVNDDEINAVDMFSDALTELGFGVIEENHELDLGLALGFDSMDSRDSDVDVCGDDDSFVERGISGLSASEAASNFSGVERFGDNPIVGFRSDSDDVEENGNDNGALTIYLNSGDDYGIDDGYDVDDDDVSVSIPLCWDSLQLEDHRETNEDFEWEEVDGRVDEREVLSVFVDGDDDDDENSVSLSISPVISPEDADSFDRAAGVGTVGWEVLLNGNNLEINPEMDENAEPYFADRDDYLYTAEYDMLFGQFAQNENAFIGRPPASKSVVENLPSVVVTQEDVANNNALCAVCKDEVDLGERMKQLPCAHRYHGDCIIPWLGIRNTCPVCRHELPTDDADYERRRPLRAGGSL